jgi:hypothetical protein
VRVQTADRLPVALVTRGESGTAVVAGEALPVAAVISDGYEPLLPGLEQLGSCRWQPGMTIGTDVALGGVRAVVKGDRPLTAPAVIQCPDLLSERSQAQEARRQHTQRPSQRCSNVHPRPECFG